MPIKPTLDTLTANVTRTFVHSATLQWGSKVQSHSSSGSREAVSRFNTNPRLTNEE